MNSPLALRNKSYSSREVTPTSPNVAPNVVRQGKHSGTEIMTIAMVIVDTAIVLLAKCSRQYAPIVARKLKYRLSLAKVDRCTAEIATIKSGRADKLVLICKIYMGWVYPGPYIFNYGFTS